MVSCPKTPDEFYQLMESIDAGLRKAGVPIHARSLHAIHEYCERFQLSVRLTATAKPTRSGVYDGADAVVHIRKWFDDRYGDRQRIFAGPGTTIVLLKGELWEIRLPRVYGSVQLVVERDLNRYANEPNIRSDGKPPTMNLLDLIDKFPPGLAAQLSDEECRSLLIFFKAALDSMQAIESMASLPLVPEAISDIQASVRFAMSVPHHFGQSKWSSAQAAEKLLKSLLISKGVKYEFNHAIGKVANMAANHGMKPLDMKVINNLEIRPAARYGEVAVSMVDAAIAHHASLEVGKRIADTIMNTD